MVVQRYAFALRKASFFTFRLHDQIDILFILSVVGGRGDTRPIANRPARPYIVAVRDFACLVAAREGLLP
jgi:hypothetical protein